MRKPHLERLGASDEEVQKWRREIYRQIPSEGVICITRLTGKIPARALPAILTELVHSGRVKETSQGYGRTNARGAA